VTTQSVTSSLPRIGLNNILAGLIVAVVALPLCIAFAIASGASPMAGVVSGVVGGGIAAVSGSSRFQVSGPAAAFITVIAGIIASHGLPVLMAATFGAGFIVIAIGLLKLGRLMEFMPHPIIVGFTTGIGLLILIGQIPVALGVAAEGEDAIAKLINTVRDIHTISIQEVVIVALSFIAALSWGRTRFNRWVPAPLVALGVGLGMAELMAWQGLPVATVGAAYSVSVEGLGVSTDFLQTILSDTNAVLLSALTLGLLIAVESLLSAKALDSVTNTTHDPNRELFGLGLANTVVPFLGGLPVSGVIVRGSTNVMSGATKKSAALMHAVFLGIFVAALASVVARLPMAALAAVLFMTAIRLIEVGEIRKIHLMGAAEGRLAILTAALTVLVDLTVSVPVGLALTLLLVLRRTLKHGTIAVRERHGVHVADPGTQVTFLTSPRIRPQIDAALESETKPVRALDLSKVSAMDATGLSMVAEVLDRHPHLDVWVASAEKTLALQHAGVAEDRIHILGNRLVRLRDVLAAIQSNVPTELAAASAKTR
jgi:sulfate permease, SulP family